MKNYSSNRAQKGKTAYRTPSRFKAGQPEKAKRMPLPQGRHIETGNSSHFSRKG